MSVSRRISAGPAWSQSEKIDRTRFGVPDSATFFDFARHFARSPEAGPVGSQYESRLRRGELAGEPRLSLLGLWVESHLVAAMSSGLHTLPRGHSLSGRIDLVLTHQRCRGRGLASLLMSQYLVDLIDTQRERVAHLSVVAQHPAIARFVEAMGYEPFMKADAPIFEKRLDDVSRKQLYLKARAARNRLKDKLAIDDSGWWNTLTE